MLCVSLTTVACGNESEGGDQRQGAIGTPTAEQLTACLRDSGATVKEVAPPRHAGAEDKRLQATFRSGYAGVFLIYRSHAAAERRHNEHRRGQAAAVLRKGGVVLAYSASQVDATTKSDMTTLEDCLRESGDGSEPPPGELARQLGRIEARREARARQYRSRQYNTPTEIKRAIERLRGYDRYRLYYLGERYAGLPLVAVTSKLQPTLNESANRLSRPISPTFTFIYGDCEPSPGSEGRCSAPLQITNFEACAVSASMHRVPLRALTKRIRGVPYLFNEGAGSLNLFTGATTITIFFDSRRLARRAAEDVRSLDGSIAAGSTLPPPVPGALEGRLRCRPSPD